MADDFQDPSSEISQKGSSLPRMNVTGLTGGHADYVIAAGNIHGDVHVHSDKIVQELRDATLQNIEEYSTGMVRVSAVEKVIQKLKDESWVTITGNAGDGKTTLGYLVLEAMKEDGYDVFKVDTPTEFRQIVLRTKDCVIMLNDIFGAFTFDVSAQEWIRFLEDSHKKLCKKPKGLKSKAFRKEADTASVQSHTYVICISRKNVLNGAKNALGRLADFILDHSRLVDLSNISVKQEKLDILNFHLDTGGIRISASLKSKIVSGDIPHGFPHCCQIYVELVLSGKDIKIEDFFESPLRFLDQTTKVFMDDPDIVALFMKMCQNSGQLDDSSISEGKERAAIQKLTGSYLKKSAKSIMFSHPSIYESVVTSLAQTYPTFVATYATVSVIMQKVNLTGTEDDNAEDSVNVQLTSEVLSILCRRFQKLIQNFNFSVLANTRICGNPEFCEKLLDKSVRKSKIGPLWRLFVNKRDADGYTLLHTAVRGGNNAAIPILLKHGASVKKSHASSGKTALHFLCETGNPDINSIQQLAASGADVNKADKVGRTPFTYLCWSDKADVRTIQLMIDNGADSNMPDENGMTALHYLCYSGKADVSTIELLTKSGADVNKGDRFQRTALHYLCWSGKTDVSTMEFLINCGADVNTVDKDGRLPLHLLCLRDKADSSTVRLLLKNGVDAKIADGYGRTPVYYLRHSLKTDVIKLLK